MADKKVNTKKKATATKVRTRGKGALPSKRNINLAVVGVEKMNYVALVPSIIIIVILAALFSKLAIVDRLNAVSAAQNRQSNLQNQLDATYEEIKSYGELSDDYSHYTYSGFTQEELNRADRMAAIDLINTIVLPQATVANWTISGNEIDLPIVGSSLEHLNEIASELEADDRVDFCVVTTATTNNALNNYIYDDYYSYTDVTGQVTIYLTGELEGGNE